LAEAFRQPFLWQFICIAFGGGVNFPSCQARRESDWPKGHERLLSPQEIYLIFIMAVHKMKTFLPEMMKTVPYNSGASRWQRNGCMGNDALNGR